MTNSQHMGNDSKYDKLSPLLRTVFIVVVVALLIGFYRIYTYIWPTPYVAAQSGFQIVFPGTPTVSKLPSQKSAGVAETGMIYSVVNQKKGTDYAVYVTNYAQVNFNSYSKASKIQTLEDEVETVAKNSQSSISSGQTTTFDTMTAVEATLAPADSSDPTTHLLAFLNASKLYILFGAGMSTSKFNSYVKTFHFTH